MDGIKQEVSGQAWHDISFGQHFYCGLYSVIAGLTPQSYKLITSEYKLRCRVKPGMTFRLNAFCHCGPDPQSHKNKEGLPGQA